MVPVSWRHPRGRKKKTQSPKKSIITVRINPSIINPQKKLCWNYKEITCFPENTRFKKVPGASEEIAVWTRVPGTIDCFFPSESLWGVHFILLNSIWGETRHSQRHLASVMGTCVWLIFAPIVHRSCPCVWETFGGFLVWWFEWLAHVDASLSGSGVMDGVTNSHDHDLWLFMFVAKCGHNSMCSHTFSFTYLPNILGVCANNCMIQVFFLFLLLLFVFSVVSLIDRCGVRSQARFTVLWHVPVK